MSLDWNKAFAPRALKLTASEIRELLKLINQPDIISFAGGIPDPALFPHAVLAETFHEILSNPETRGAALQYSVSEGYQPLREWLAKTYLPKVGIATHADNILITNGSQQALEFLAKLFIGTGDRIIVSNPSYLGALQAFNAYEPNYDQLTLNGNRTPDSYRQMAESKGGRAKFAYLSVDFANPTGETVDFEGRKKVLALAEELDIAVIEDAAYQSLRFDGTPVPPILSLEIAQKGGIDETRTIYCGSFSKTLAPGLRVGWIVANSAVIRKLVLMKQAADLHSSSIN